MNLSRLSFLALTLLALCLLPACGPFSIQIEPILTPTPIVSTLPPLQITLTPTRAPVTPTLPPTPPPPTATMTVPDLRFKPGTALKMVKTHMLTVQSGWAVAEGAGDLSQHIFFTSDGGATWKDCTPSAALVNAPATGWVATTYFASAENAWAFYAERTPTGNPLPLVVWRTRDGGRSWERSAPLELNEGMGDYRSPSDLGFFDDQRGWVLVHLGVGMSHDYVALFTTADGGKTWQRMVDPDSQSALMPCYKSGVAFTSPTTGWISGDCPGLLPKLFFYRTSDGGATWVETTLPVPPGKAANYFAQNGIGCGIPALTTTATHALAVTLRCTSASNNTVQSWLYLSKDSGVNWSQRMLPLPYTRLDLFSPDEILLVGSLQSGPDATGVVFRTANGGSDWAQLTVTGWTGLPDFVDLQNGWVIATHNQVTAFVRTMDGGRNWGEIKPVVATLQ